MPSCVPQTRVPTPAPDTFVSSLLLWLRPQPEALAQKPTLCPNTITSISEYPSSPQLCCWQEMVEGPPPVGRLLLHAKRRFMISVVQILGLQTARFRSRTVPAFPLNSCLPPSALPLHRSVEGGSQRYMPFVSCPAMLFFS